MTYTVGYIIGSLSKDSINRKLLDALVKLAPESLTFVEIPIADLPVYNRDVDADYPEVAVEYKKAIEATDALVYATPEYNRSIPGSLKNAIDWASRPWGQSVLGRPSAIVGASLGQIGTAVAQAHLRQMLGFFGAVTFVQPELYVHWTDTLTQEDGSFTPDAAAFFQTWMDGFAAFVAKQAA